MKEKLEKLKEQRKKKKISRKQMAKLLGISFYTYRAYEQKDRQIKAETLKKISIILECKTDDLI